MPKVKYSSYNKRIIQLDVIVENEILNTNFLSCHHVNKPTQFFECAGLFTPPIRFKNCERIRPLFMDG